MATYLQCPLCGNFAKCHAHQLSHVAAAHPTYLDSVAMGRLGNIIMYQSAARLFHCADCFFTSRDFTKLYQHIISKHCMDETATVGEGADGEDDRSEKGDKEADEEGKELEEERKEVKEEEEEVDEELEEDVKEADEEVKEVDEVMKEGNDADETTPQTQDSGENVKDEDASTERMISDADQSVLAFNGDLYRCLICNWWKNKLKVVAVNHAVRKHGIPREFVVQRIRQDDDATSFIRHLSGGADEDDEDGLSGDRLKEELKATSKVVGFFSGRYVCLICGWKTKRKGFVINHVVRSHNVERPYRCKDCKRSFFLPSRLLQHVRAAHRPGRFACPFCCFRSHFLVGFRRHCGRCAAREGLGMAMGEEGRGGLLAVKEETKETRAGRKRARRLIEEADDEDELMLF
ncbi:zinc finger protein 407-like [Syngnathoides biaculeatus]|uniref:zinc finger protein 407-like n=1 Tax=Syngnathoides biaculeatus TaxID=300417 RepID=UPI002ADE49A3|nr:zinc finger protein 407-like [Syngnathoides biaculeatus]XP_061693949.1 zinc finger protein 407-like [Syngnathoides biaculeatus]